jgi:hypothetical protein
MFEPMFLRKYLYDFKFKNMLNIAEIQAFFIYISNFFWKWH